MELLKGRRSRLELSLQLQHNFQEMVYILDSMEELKVRLLSDDYGKHLLGKFPFPVLKKIYQQQFDEIFILFIEIQFPVSALKKIFQQQFDEIFILFFKVQFSVSGFEKNIPTAV